MKQSILSVLLAIFLFGCKTSAPYQLNKNELLISVYYKRINNGYIVFLRLTEEGQIEKTTYNYSVKIKSKTAMCWKRDEEILHKEKDKEKYKIVMGNLRPFKTTENFKEYHINSWRKRYYDCFSIDFLDLTNEEKKLLLERLEKDSPNRSLNRPKEIIDKTN